MNQEKNERLVLRITSELKKSIEELAKKQNVSASELVRNVLEDVVCKKKKEIESQARMISSIDKRINHLLQELIFADKEKKINNIKKELRDYKKLSNSQQVEVIEMILEETNYSDSKTQQLKAAYEDDFLTYEKLIETFSEDANTKENAFQEKYDPIYEKLWNSTYKLYKHLCNRYLSN